MNAKNSINFTKKEKKWRTVGWSKFSNCSMIRTIPIKCDLSNTEDVSRGNERSVYLDLTSEFKSFLLLDFSLGDVCSCQ